MIRSFRAERGSASLGLALITPALLVVLLFVVALGRLGQARGQIDGAAAQAARAASIARNPAAARAAAEQTASATLTAGSLPCAGLEVAVDTSGFRPGGQVVVDLTCTVSLGSLSGMGLQGSKTLNTRAVAVIDAFRGGA
jgi:Flp pilus assembly protein TadG